MMSTIPVTLAKIIRQEKSCQIIVILLAEQLQMVLPLLFTGMRSHLADMRTRAFSYYEPTTAPLTSDLIVHILDVFGGTVEEITIDTLQEDILYAQVRLHTTTAVHTLRARLDDALLLALRLNCTLSVSENVFHTMGISLVDQGRDRGATDRRDHWDDELATASVQTRKRPLPLTPYLRPILHAIWISPMHCMVG